MSPDDSELNLFSLENIPVSDWKRKPSKPKDILDDAREFGGWTLEKLQVLELYFKLYRRVAGSGTYIDAFAGDGRVSVDGKERPGSVDVAIRSRAFRSLHLVEKDADLNTRLDHYIRYNFTGKARRHIKLYPPSDCNSLIPELLANGSIDPDRPCFAFLDPDSTQLAWSTVESLAQFRDFDPEARRCKVELWILFNTHQAFQRMWPKDRLAHPTNPNPRALNSIMGDESAWLDLYEEGKGVGALVYRYAERLMDELGYQWAYPQIILDPSTGRPQYHMVHATDHPAAVGFMRWAKSELTPHGGDQLELFN